MVHDDLTRGEAARTTVTALRVMGRVEDVDASLINELITTADAIDTLDPASPQYPALVRCFTTIETKVHDRLNRAADDDSGPGSIADLLAAMGDQS